MNLQVEYENELITNPEFSLEVDPENKYEMTETQKKFIRNYIQFKSINTAAELSGIKPDEGMTYFIAYSTQQEIRRINRALYQRQFSHKLLSLDEIGGYLSSLITNENVPLADQLNTKEKLNVVNTLMDVMKFKQESLKNPAVFIESDIIVEEELKELSVDTLRNMLKQKNIKNKNAIAYIENNSKVDFTLEEKAYLQTLPTKQILNLLESTNKGD